ncbi:MAG: hypothetical protein CL920_02590 [Deltaproteobacteria bacterium]|nr:hypothetical protein [Deltaproteobacteria bacterium]
MNQNQSLTSDFVFHGRRIFGKKTLNVQSKHHQTKGISMKNIAILFLFASSLVWSSPSWAFKVKIYGNWCGPEHGFKKAPKDALDRVCQQHDICIKNKIRSGRKRPIEKFQFCECDRALLKNVMRAARKVKTKKAMLAAKVMKNYFARTLCYCRKRICVKVPKCRKVRTCVKNKKRRKICTKVPTCKMKKKCKTLFGKKICYKTPKCKSKKKCIKLPKGKLCAPTPKCKMVKKCSRITSLGKGGRCF